MENNGNELRLRRKWLKHGHINTVTNEIFHLGIEPMENNGNELRLRRKCIKHGQINTETNKIFHFRIEPMGSSTLVIFLTVSDPVSL